MKTNRPGGLTLTRSALELCEFQPRAPILDAGCGYGATCRFLAREAGLRAVGMDASEERLSRAKKDGAVVRSRLPRLPFKAGAFQGIFCECVFSLVPDKSACLNEFFRVLQPGGKLVLTDLYLPGRDTEYPPGPFSTCLDGAVTPAALGRILGESRFMVTKFEDHTRLLKEMACEMVFEHGSLDNFWQSLASDTGICSQGLAARFRAGILKYGYCMVIAQK